MARDEVSFFAETTPEEYDDLPRGPDGGARGRTQLSFSESFRMAYDEQVRAWSVFGLEKHFREEEAEQLERYYQATGERLEPVGLIPQGRAGRRETYAPYFDAAEYFEAPHRGGTGEADAPRPSVVDRIRHNEKKFREAAEQVPGIKSYREMWQDTKRRAQEVTEDFSIVDNDFFSGGSVGSFLGATAGAFHPGTDLVNTVTLLLGGFGSTIAKRIGTEFGVQSVIEGVNQFTGVQRNRELLGLPNSTEQAIRQSLYVGVGGAAFRAVGEAIGAGVRALGGQQDTSQRSQNTLSELTESLPQQVRSFDEIVTQPSGQVSNRAIDAVLTSRQLGEATASPYGASREARLRHEIDFEDLKTALDSNISPLDVFYKTGARTTDPDLAARLADPDLFAKIDRLDGLIARQRERLAALRDQNRQNVRFDPELLAEADRLKRQLDEAQEAYQNAKTPTERRRFGRKIQAIQSRLNREEIVDLDTALDRAETMEGEVTRLREEADQVKDKRRAKRLRRRADELEQQIPRMLARFDLDAAERIPKDITRVSRRLDSLQRKRDELRPLEQRARERGSEEFLAPITRPELPVRLRRDGFVPDAPLVERKRVEAGDGDTPPDGPLSRVVDDLDKAREGDGAAGPQTVDLGDGVQRNLDDEILTPVKDESGDVVGVTAQRIRDVIDDWAEDKRLGDAMRFCGLKGGK